MAAREIRPAKLRILLGEEIAMGPGKASLLEAIADTGSISAAARQLRMSYRRAWLLVDTMNRCFREPLVMAGTGGKGGGGAIVTPFGHEVLARFRALESAAQQAIAPSVARFAELLSPDPRRQR